ncbi:MAG: Uma2 family endonuclease [Chloroflexota bacterium]
MGRPKDFRVPDLVFLRGTPDPIWQPTAAIVVEVVSPGDESRLKFGHYFRTGVEEFLIVDPAQRTVEWFERRPDAFRPVDGSRLLGLTGAGLASAIDWPA